MAETIELLVNGARRKVPADPSRSLLRALRDDLDLTGTKYGCGEGDCGACTVLIDGVAKRSCVTTVGAAAGAEIRTIEGVAPEGSLHPVQRCFLEANAMQCGYCTPGMVLSAIGLLRGKPDPSEREIVSAMNGNLCRCGTYPRIVRAIRAAADLLKREKR
ncbi:MAG: (2Fe-2S)-binding protein [Planctomycetota bacterium]